ncbi:antibiotic biosynthesis monooxygenase family protein [Shimia aestuarii]|uniref:antibiotic biosynthesis monooxygenase family protein n=1 Tax=Shimia aestuarii TaxID=254406 RepID=UPI001FB2FB1A|nr:antibiotic biosynthesis monooxygenase [Shimia aestuarii]
MSQTNSRFAPLPDPPYYAVIFTAERTEGDLGYGTMADHMMALAERQPGYIGVESTRDEEGLGITVSYWKDEDSILAWKAEAEHLAAQTMGKTRWYRHYTLRVAKVERAYSGPEGRL